MSSTLTLFTKTYVPNVQKVFDKKEKVDKIFDILTQNFLIRTIFSNSRILRNELKATDQISIDLILHKMKFETINRERDRRKNVYRSNQLKKGVI